MLHSGADAGRDRGAGSSVLLSLVLAGSILGCASVSTSQDGLVFVPPTPEPPNLVIVLADDLGWGDLGSFGQAIIRTPHLDRMAREGQRWTSFYSGDAWCPVARNSLYAGRHAGHTALRGNGPLPEDSADSPRYLPRLLSVAGYRVGLFGKWGLAGFGRGVDGREAPVDGRPSHVGFDEFLGYLTHRDAHTHELPPYPQEQGDAPIRSALWEISAGETVEAPRSEERVFLPDLLLAEAKSFLRRHRDRPFALVYPTSLPHAEYFLPAADPAWALYLKEDGTSRFPEVAFAGNGAFRRPVPAPKAAYAALVTRLDRDVGALLETLEELDLARRTLVIFVSDNGPAADGGFESPDFFDSAGGLRGRKRSLYEGGIRVPMIAWWPGTIPAGSVRDDPAGLWDLLPTILDLAGAPRPPNLDGVSLREALVGGSLPRRAWRAPLYWETRFLERSQAVRVGRWKLVRPRVEGVDDDVELYDLVRDPEETRDLSARKGLCSLRRRLTSILNREHQEGLVARFEVPRLQAECPLSQDGFESGDASAWSLSDEASAMKSDRSSLPEGSEDGREPGEPEK